MLNTSNPSKETIIENIMTFDEIRQYFFSLEDHMKFKKANDISQSDKVVTWEGSLHKKDLYLYGTSHALDSNHSQYKYLQERRNDFYAKHKNEKIIILSEGGVRELRANDTINSSIEAFGEPGLLAWIAREYNTEIATPEPNEVEEVKVLSKSFDLLAVLYYFTGRNAYWTLKKGAPVDVINDLGTKKIAKLSPGSSISFKELHNTLFPEKPFHEITSDRLAPLMNPLTPHNSIINKVSAGEDDLIRDPYIIQQILLWNQKGYNIFLAYGRDHLVKRQPLLKYWATKN